MEHLQQNGDSQLQLQKDHLFPSHALMTAENGGQHGLEKRKRMTSVERQRHAAAAQAEEKMHALTVVGYACKLFRDDDTASSLHREKHMLVWHGREDLGITIDRYDVRAHLDNHASFVKMKSFARDLDRVDMLGVGAVDQHTVDLLEAERYLDLRADKEEHSKDEDSDEQGNKRQKTGEEWHYDYTATNSSTSAHAKQQCPPPPPPGMSATHPAPSASATNSSAAPPPPPPPPPFKPSFEVPPDLLLPDTERQHMIMQRTAEFVRQTGGQAEIRLRLRHSLDSALGFLFVEHALHPYYQFLKDTGAVHVRKETTVAQAPSTANSVSLVGYESASDDEDVDNTSSNNSQIVSSTDVAVDAGAMSEEPHGPTAAAAPAPEAGAGVSQHDVLRAIQSLAPRIAKLGSSFEQLVRRRETNNPLFDFLNPWDPNHAAYRQAVDAAAASPPEPPTSAAALPPPPGMCLPTNSGNSSEAAASEPVGSASASVSTDKTRTAHGGTEPQGNSALGGDK